MNLPITHERVLGLFVIDLQVAGKRDATIEHYSSATKNFAEWYKATFGREPHLEDLSLSLSKQYLVGLRNKHESTATVKNRFVGYRAFTNWLEQEGLVSSSLTSGIPTPRVDDTVKEPVPIEEVKRVIEFLNKRRNWKTTAIIQLMAETGMRSSEVRGLSCNSIDWEAQTITLTKTKNHGTRTVAFSYELHRALLRHLGGQLAGPQLVFPNAAGHAYRRETLWALVRKAFKQAGSTYIVGPHVLRHSAASAYALAGMDSRDMDTIFGWDDPRSGRTYTRTVMERRAVNAQRALSPFKPTDQRK